MATRTIVSLVDDLDGTAAEESVEFGLDGATYEIDLSEANAALLREAVAQYISSARRTGGRRRVGTRATSSSVSSRPASSSAGQRSSEDNQRIRAWATEHGAFVPARGRIPGLLVAAYEANDPSMLPAAASDAPSSTDSPTTTANAEPEREGTTQAQGSSAGETEQPRGRDGLTASERELIRAWAVEEGIEVKTRGQLKKDLIANYEAVAARR